MHELTLASRLLSVIEEEGRRRGFTRVDGVTLALGRLSCVEPDALRLCFEVVSRSTLAEGAELELRFVEATGRCLSCGREVQVEAFHSPCPECGTPAVRVTGGTEMRVIQLTVG